MKIPVFKALKSSRKATILAALGGLVILLGGSSAYAARSNALPGSPLYPLKQLWEQGAVLLSFSPASKARAHLNIAQDRIKALQSSSVPTPVRAQALQTVQQNLNSALDQSNNVTDQTKRKELKDDISKEAVEAEQEVEHAKEVEKTKETDSSKSNKDKQDIKQSGDQIKQVKDRSAKD